MLNLCQRGGKREAWRWCRETRWSANTFFSSASVFLSVPYRKKPHLIRSKFMEIFQNATSFAPQIERAHHPLCQYGKVGDTNPPVFLHAFIKIATKKHGVVQRKQTGKYLLQIRNSSSAGQPKNFLSRFFGPFASLLIRSRPRTLWTTTGTIETTASWKVGKRNRRIFCQDFSDYLFPFLSAAARGLYGRQRGQQRQLPPER